MKLLRLAIGAGVLAAAGIAAPAVQASPLAGEIAVAGGLVALEAPVSCSRFGTVSAWARQHGYSLPRGEGVCRQGPDSPAVSLGWNTAAVWANALSEMSGRVPAYHEATGAISRDAVTLEVVPEADPHVDGFRLPTLAELGLPRLRALMNRDLQVWSGSRIDLGDGSPYYYLCKPGACDFHSSGMSGRGVGFRLVRSLAP